MLKIKNKDEKNAEIYISGNIVDDADGDFLSSVWGVEDGYEWPAKIRQQLDELKGKDLTIYINSDGGYVAAGVAMANMIARHEGHTTAVVDGWCCSIATQIFFSADERKMPENAYLMIHKPAVAVAGDAYDLRKTADVLDTLQEGLETTYRNAAKEGVTAEAITEMVNEETWLTGAEASKIFDIALLAKSEAVACAGKKPMNFKKVPDDLRFSDRGKDPAEIKNVESVDNTMDKCRIEAALAIAKGVLKDEEV